MLSHFARRVDGIYYQATRKTEREQLATLSRIVNYSGAAAEVRFR